MNGTQLAQAAAVSTSCVYRFCHKLGFEGFSAFRIQLASELNEKLSSPSEVNYDYPFTEKESTAQLIQTLGSLYKTSIDETIRLLDITQLETFAEHIYQARFTYILTTNTNLQAAENFARKMEEIGISMSRGNCCSSVCTVPPPSRGMWQSSFPTRESPIMCRNV